MIIVTGSVEVRPEAVERAIELSLEHVRRSRTEPGCLLHSVHRDVERPRRLVFLEHWSDLDALRAHFAVPASIEFVQAMGDLATARPEIRVHVAEPAAL